MAMSEVEDRMMTMIERHAVAPPRTLSSEHGRVFALFQQDSNLFF